MNGTGEAAEDVRPRRGSAFARAGVGRSDFLLRQPAHKSWSVVHDREERRRLQEMGPFGGEVEQIRYSAVQQEAAAPDCSAHRLA